MEKEEIRHRINRPRSLLLVDLGLALLEKALENGHVVDCDEYKVCYWCGTDYSFMDEECNEHEDSCVWPMVKSTIGWYETVAR